MFGLTFLGDGGAYIIALLTGYLFIANFNLNITISPYYIALLLWYPAFENLFSLSRRLLLNRKVSKPDNLHLHQLIYLQMKKIPIKNYKIINSISSFVILFYNLLIFIIATKYFSSTKILANLIMLNLIIYLALYYFLSKYSMYKK